MNINELRSQIEQLLLKIDSITELPDLKLLHNEYDLLTKNWSINFDGIMFPYSKIISEINQGENSKRESKIEEHFKEAAYLFKYDLTLYISKIELGEITPLNTT